MHRFPAVGFVGAALVAALGPSLLACNGKTTPDGAVSVKGTPIVEGVCTNPSPIAVNGVDTGFVSCAEGYTHRAAVVA